MQEYSYKNQFGSIKISFDTNIMTTEFEGAISTTIVKYLIKIADKFIKNISAKPWGYVSSSTKAQALTPDGYALLVKAAKAFKKGGCVKSAYVLSSFIAIDQTQKLREEVGVTSPIEDVLFGDLAQAKDFIADFLNSYK